MRVIRVKSSIKGRLEPTSFLLGYVGEKKSTTLSFNIERIAEKFPDNTLTYTLSFLQERQEGEKRTILFSGRFAIGGLIDYDIETTALLEAGEAFLQLGAYTLGDERIWLSEMLPMKIEESIEGATPPEDLPASWYEDLVAVAGEIGLRVQEASELAPEMEENAAKAKESELAAKESENQAKGFRDETESFRNETEIFRNESEDFRDETKNIADEIEGLGDNVLEAAGVIAETGEEVEARYQLITGINDEIRIAKNEINDKAIEVEGNRIIAEEKAAEAKESADGAKISEINAGESEGQSNQNLNDLINIIGSDVAPVVGGKIPIDYIPFIAIHDIFEVNDEEEILLLPAQKGDVASIVETDNDQEGNVKKVAIKRFQLLADDPTNYWNWAILGTSFATEATHSQTSEYAENANKINGHRIILFETVAEAESAVKVSGSFYLAPYDRIEE